MKKKYLKKSSEELQEYLKFKRRGYVVPPKKGKGSYRRKSKHADVGESGLNQQFAKLSLGAI